MQTIRNQPTRSDCLATLSSRAQRMLEFAKWLREPDDYESVIEMLESVGIEPGEALIQLQLCFGALDYHARYYGGVGWDFDVKAGFVDPEENTYLVDALNHKSAQLLFAVDVNGKIYIETRQKHTDPMYWELYADSFSQLIEGDAILDELTDLCDDPVATAFSYSELALSGFHRVLQTIDPTFSRVDEASDDNIAWWINESLRIEYHKAWLGVPNPGKYWLNIYGFDLETVRAFARKVIEAELFPRKEKEFRSRTARLYYGYP